MAANKLGTKRHCQSCDGKFYDLNKTPIVCPGCGATFDPEVLLKSRRTKPVAAAPVKSEQPDPETVTEDADLDSNIDADDDAIETDGEVLNDDDDLIIVGADGNDDEDANTNEDMPIEDNLDAVDGDDIDDIEGENEDE